MYNQLFSEPLNSSENSGELKAQIQRVNSSEGDEEERDSRPRTTSNFDENRKSEKIRVTTS